MSTEQIETVIIGAGQAGLATGYHLQRRGRPFLILDANERIGDGWRRQWDTLRLYSPAKYDGLPGMAFPAPAWSFPGKEGVADFLESYAVRFRLPVRLGTWVDRVGVDNGDYLVSCGDHVIRAANVVIATGTFGRTASIPGFADQLDPGILQLHSSEYRRPAQLRPGLVLVVGASHSGADVAYEVAATHPVILCGRDTGHIPVRLESPAFKVVFPALLFVFRHVLTRRTPLGRKQMEEFRFHGGPALRVQSRDLAGRGVERVTSRIAGVRDGLPVLDDGRVVQPASVVWCTGFRQAFGWVDVPVFGDDGWPEEVRGVVDTAPGLFFCGLGFQYAASSMLIAGAGRDAAYVAKRIAQRSPALSGADARVR